MRSYTRVLLGAVGLWLWITNTYADSCSPWISRVISVQGTVEAKRATQSGWSEVGLNDEFCAGDTIHTDIHSRAGLLLSNETVLRLDQRTTLVLPELDEEDSAWLNLLQGALHLISNVSYHLKIKTPFVNAAMEGTEFAVRVAENDTKVWVIEGRVVVENTQGKIRLEPGEAAQAETGKAPAPYLKITPRDAVQWALYYPPIIDNQAAGDPDRQRAVSLYRAGRIPAAIQTLNSISGSAQDSSFYTQRAAILLAVGDIQSALDDIDQALALSPQSGTPLALKSIIALTRNDKQQARSLAQKAVELEPKSPAARVALSFAQQAAFDIEGARESIQKALELSPDDPLAWARLSELELSSGNLDEALEAARKAEALDPELSHTKMVLGFAQLMQIDVDEAKESFNKAINLDPSAPLPRLGMGLAKIRQGNVEEGTRDIEVAALLDPQNSLVRSYLGKAYYEEKRGSVASREFNIAKQLDPKDPTPWFYDAIHKQTTNRPVEALHDMQKAIELNDNRAVYRSSLLLDDDLAARSAGLGRIYNDIGFHHRGLLEGWKSVNTDPGNYSAHRLMADNYAALPRHKIARVSELLQSQLLQPLNITPVQPQLGETNLFILSGAGPAAPAFNEFNPLFSRNRLALQTSGVVGTHDTYGDEVTQSGIWNRFSYSIGQFHYETDGFQENNDLNHNLYNTFVQAFVSPSFSVQAEFRHNETKNGDLTLNFDPNDFDESFRRVLRTNTARLGMKVKPAIHSTIIASGLYQTEKEHTESDFFGDANVKNSGYLGEAQYLFHIPRFSAALGGGYFNSTNEEAIPVLDTDNKISVRHANFYLYTNTRYPSKLTWTLGLSFDKLQDERIGGRIESVNPKVGLLWDISQNTILRMAAFRTVKRPILNDQTIEPTQVAGFNQLFDDFLGTGATRYGIAIDHKFTGDIFAGVEASSRDLVTQLAVSGKDKWHEELYRAYINWILAKSVTLDLEYRFEKFQRNEMSGKLDDSFPTTETHFAPIGINYFHPSGFFSRFGITYIYQKVDFFTESASGHDDFFLFDVRMGFRLPKRYGIISLNVKNLFDQNFRYQGDHRRTNRDVAPLFLPERSILAQITLVF